MRFGVTDVRLLREHTVRAGFNLATSNVRDQTVFAVQQRELYVQDVTQDDIRY